MEQGDRELGFDGMSYYAPDRLMVLVLLGIIFVVHQFRIRVGVCDVLTICVFRAFLLSLQEV